MSKRQRTSDADGAASPSPAKRAAAAAVPAAAPSAAAAPPAAAADATLLALGLPAGHPCAPFLRAQLARPYFAKLLAFLAAARTRGAVFPPPGRELACLALCASGLAGVRVVVLGQDPYHGAGQANGLAFSVARGVPHPPSLRNIFKELHEDVGGGGGGGGGGGAAAVHGNLEGWARSGVLLLNTCLTVSSGAANSHAGAGWEALTDAIIAEVSRVAAAGCVFVLWGKPAQAKRALIEGAGARHLVLEAPHPSPLSCFRGFYGSKPFSKANAWLAARGLEPVDWVGALERK
jgi:uracil-DNA glycosylase